MQTPKVGDLIEIISMNNDDGTTEEHYAGRIGYVQTARANGLKSEQYLAYVISNINKKGINDLLPWSDKLPKNLLIPSK